MTLEEQINALKQLPEPWAVKKSRNVRGEFTTGDFVEWKLRNIFGPHNWRFNVQTGPEVIRISETEAYAQVTGRLSVVFNDGQWITQDAVGVWPLKATKASEGGTLENGTSAERYETVIKAAVTDSLKACAERLGTCFRPMRDLELRAEILRRNVAASPQGQAERAKSPAQHQAELTGKAPPPSHTAGPGSRRPAPIPTQKHPVATPPIGGTSPTTDPPTPETQAKAKAETDELMGRVPDTPQAEESPPATAPDITAANFWKLASSARRDGVTSDQVQAAAEIANGDGWTKAVGHLQRMIQNAQRDQALPADNRPNNRMFKS